MRFESRRKSHEVDLVYDSARMMSVASGSLPLPTRRWWGGTELWVCTVQYIKFRGEYQRLTGDCARHILEDWIKNTQFQRFEMKHMRL